MNKCKDCMYGKCFKDIFTGKIRHKCGINQSEQDEWGDSCLIIDGECEKFKDGSEKINSPKEDT